MCSDRPVVENTTSYPVLCTCIRTKTYSLLVTVDPFRVERFCKYGCSTRVNSLRSLVAHLPRHLILYIL